MPNTNLPENYPSGCANKELIKVINDLQKQVKEDAHYDNQAAFLSVVKISSLIQLGQTELSGRFTKKYSLLALGISILSLLIAVMALLR
jgi:hypothetical protein